MVVTLDDLPKPLPSPTPPGAKQGLLTIVLCGLLGSCLAVLFWPGDMPRWSLWYVCCVVVLPVMGGLLAFALRRLVYERQRDYAQRWNQQRLDHERGLIEQGQRAAGVLATSYCTPAASQHLARALRSGSVPLQPVYLSAKQGALRFSQLAPAAQHYTACEYRQRLACFLPQVLSALHQDIADATRHGRLCVRMKHNSVLSDDELLAAWRTCVVHDALLEEVHFVAQEDGLLWLDEWLDTPDPADVVLSLELNLFLHPVEKQAESVSAVLLAHPQFCRKHALQPQSWVHRPAVILDATTSLPDAMRWGRVAEGHEKYFIWQLQLSPDQRCRLSLEMSRTGRSIDREQCMQLDDVFGRPAGAVGNIGVIVASEQAVADAQAQLVVMQDKTVHGFVVRPGEQQQGRAGA